MSWPSIRMASQRKYPIPRLELSLGRPRRALSAELDEDTPLSDCADHLVVVNNVLNSAIPLVSEDCQDILRLDVLSPAGSQFHRYFIVLRNIAAHVMSYLC